MNKILRLLTLSDLFILGGFGLIQPIFAIFVIQQIRGASLSAVGVAVAVQLFTCGFFQIIIGRWADHEDGNKRELAGLVIGTILISFVPLGYIFVTSLNTLYAVQFLYGLGQAFWYPSWRVLFSRYSIQNKAGYEWATYSTIVSFGAAATAALGSYLVERFSFNSLFVIVSAASFVGCAFLIAVFMSEFKK